MTLLLTDLPTELLQRVLIYAGSDVSTLLKCEKACRVLRDVVRDDKTWQCVPVIDALAATIPEHIFQHLQPLPPSYFKSRREYACVTNAIRMSWREQQNSENILTDVLGADAWEELLHDDPRLCEPAHYNVCGFLEVLAGLNIHVHRFIFRKDTLHTLVELVQEAMLRLLSRANNVACTVASVTGKYPILTTEIFRHGTTNVLPMDLAVPTDDAGSMDRDFMTAALGLLPEHVRDTIVLRLSRRAGIIKMDNNVLELTWATLIHLIVLLIRPACTELIGSNQRDSQSNIEARKEGRVLAPHQTIQSVPPLSNKMICAACFEVAYLHTLVPQQIEDAAKSLGLVHKVYGDYWMVPGGCCETCETHWEARRDALIAQAEQDYEFQDVDDEEEEEDDLRMEYYEEETDCLCSCVMQGEDNGDSDGDSEDASVDTDESGNDAEEDFGGVEMEDDLVDEFGDMDMVEYDEV